MIAEMMASMRKGKSVRKAAAGLHRREDALDRNDRSALVPEVHFRKVLSIERKRAERSERRFVLMLVHTNKILPTSGRVVDAIAEALMVSTRETDLSGWYSNGSVLGVICTEIGSGDLRAILSALHSKVSEAIRNTLGQEHTQGMSVSFRVFPQDLELDKDERSLGTRAAPEVPVAWPNDSPEFAVVGSPAL